MPSSQRDYRDVHDAAAFQAEGGLAPRRLPARHLFEPCPIFFRRNGGPVDLVNLYRGQPVFLICNGPSFATADQEQL